MDPSGKRAALLEAGERLFSSKGYDAVTMADIASRAGVAVGTVYRLFPDKAALLTALHSGMEDRFVAVMMKAWSATPDHHLKLASMTHALLGEAQSLGEVMPLYDLTRDVAGTSSYRPGARTIAAIVPQYAEAKSAGAFIAMDDHLAAHIAYLTVKVAMEACFAAKTADHREQITKQTIMALERLFHVEPTPEQ
jgi:AcrR family transcriptional regulator